MRPLRITWRFASPVAVDSEYPIHLDALLAWAVMDEAERSGHPDPWGASDDLGRLLERTAPAAETPGAWVWKASRLSFEHGGSIHYINTIRRSEPLEYLEGYEREVIGGRPRAGIDTASGHQRGYQWLMACRWMRSATAHCVGDKAAIESALSRVRYIGKLGRNGFGLVREFDVAEDAAAEDLWRVRTLPPGVDLPKGREAVRVVRPLRAPYWRKISAQEGVEPV